MELRPITAADLADCIEVFYAADEELTVRRGLQAMPRNLVAIHRIFEHVSSTTPERAWLAEDGGKVVGFGMGADRDDLVFLAFLFVRPDTQATGVGKRLYEQVMPRTGYRATCIWSPQPISVALYARDGLVPRTPLYTFTGRPREPFPTLPAGRELAPIEQSEIDEIDREIIGFTRPADHAAWQRWERLPFAVRQGSSLLGYGYVQQSGRVGPIACRQHEDLLPVIGSLMTKVEPAEDWMIHVAGPASNVFVAMLKAGLRFDGPPVIFCETEARLDHTRYLPATFALP